MNNLADDTHTEQRPTRLAAFAVACGLSALFIVCYGLTNHLASLRGDLPTIMFDWEPGLPLIPVFVVPYMLIDALFFAAPFLCTTRRELRTHAKRVVFVTLFAALVFYIYPLELAIERPAVDGVFGPIFDFLQWFDQPHNLFPSLHVSYVLLLRILYGRHLRGGMWWAFHVWFTLTSISVIFVRQHHVADFIGGGLLAIFAFYLVPTADRAAAMPPTGSVTPRRGLAAAYLGATFALVAITIAVVTAYTWEWVLLLWPAASLAFVGAAYAGVGPRVFQKYAGRVSLAARIILWPYLFGLGVSRAWYRRRIPMCDAIDERIVLGRGLTVEEARQVVAEQRIGAVLDLTAEHDEAAPLLALEYRNVPIVDLTLPTDRQIAEAVDTLNQLTSQHTVFVHCALGFSRSAMIVAAHLVASNRFETVEEALEVLNTKRPGITVSTAGIARVKRWLDQR